MHALTHRTTVVAAALSSFLLASHVSGAVSFTETVGQSDIGHATTAFTDGVNLIRTDLFVFAGTDNTIGNLPAPQTVNGKPFSPITANFSGDTVFEFTISAPAGQYFQVNLPDGVTGGFDFNIHFAYPGEESVTVIQPPINGLKLDGVAQPLNRESSGIDPQGRAILVGGYQDEGEEYTGSFTFQTLTIWLDYTLDGGGNPLPIDDVTRTLSATAQAHVSFFTFTTDLAASPTITVVPEPASLALLAAGGMLALGRRR